MKFTKEEEFFNLIAIFLASNKIDDKSCLEVLSKVNGLCLYALQRKLTPEKFKRTKKAFLKSVENNIKIAKNELECE